MITLKEKYNEYYAAVGSYRKQLMKQESANAAEMFDYFSRLEIRCNRLLKCPELAASHRADITEMTLKIRDFIGDMNEQVQVVFDFDGEKLHTRFAELYDEAASIVEGFEDKVINFLDSKKELSEDAQLIQRRNHFTKNHAKSSSRSLTAKMSWKRNKVKNTNAIKAFHASSQGKAFHRNLSRYNRRKVEDFNFTQDDAFMVSKGISSFCTHLIIQMENELTAAAGKITESLTENMNAFQEMFNVFNELTGAMIEACYTNDKETIANVLDVVRDYYDVTGAGDKTCADADGVELEQLP